MSADTPRTSGTAATLWAEHLFTGREWLEGARLEVAADGSVAALEAGASPEGCKRLPGCAIPGVPNLHSHAHQRAMAGLAERSGPLAGDSGKDSFWTWRELMYRHLETMTPGDLEAVAAQLYVELLEAGSTAVGEFQYLHHDPAGRPYAEPAAMTLACLEAARQTGIGFTALPVFYAHGGFGGAPAGDGQRRFLHAVDAFLRLAESLEAAVEPGAEAVGIAPHSLRAVSPEELGRLAEAFAGRGPVHIHVAEQVREVEECLAWCGRRPVEWLLENAPVDASWCLIHATHMTGAETAALAASGAVAGLCPTTEANLGDGVFRAAEYLEAGGRFGIGSDSHISTSPVEELRWLEYAQRLTRGERTVLAGGPERSTGRRLLEAALAGGAQACGRPIGRLAPGSRADLVVLDTAHPLLAARRGDEILDSWIFSGNSRAIAEVWVGGRRLVEAGRHRDRGAVTRRFRATLRDLRARGS